ncbi:788_t:CDS:1, partial [Racocetra fulgida]
VRIYTNPIFNTDENTDEDEVDTDKNKAITGKVVYKYFLATSTAITQYLLCNMLDEIKRREDKFNKDETKREEK